MCHVNLNLGTVAIGAFVKYIAISNRLCDGILFFYLILSYNRLFTDFNLSANVDMA